MVSGFLVSLNKWVGGVFVCWLVRQQDKYEHKVIYGQAERPISTAKLKALLPVHTRPINVVIYHGSSGRTHLVVGFSLICFQRLSFPDVATERCPWRDNSYTRGQYIPVLSYKGYLLSILLRPQQIGTELSRDVLNPAHVPL